MSVTIILVTIETSTCYQCGIPFGMTKEFISERQRDRQELFCPNGHPQIYSENSESGLRRELAAERARLDQEKARSQDLRKQRDALDRRLSAAHGQVTKIRNRVGNGVCPCCNRHFIALSRHMASKHPDFKKEEAKV